ncbi:MAG: UDP-N-acetylmuramoyl-tripeptide--D-alanyl-D-alanine ligase [Roseovarius sp.]|nr:UDP-N-acetylmuramoyl-tripeptide--D-alanyl-D-alanine ligase [Roseovarius sp.]
MAKENLRGRYLRLDWVENVETLNWARLRKRLRDVKRNYCRRGIALDADFSRFFLEQELNASAMLYGGNAISHCIVNEKNFAIATRRKYGPASAVDFAKDRNVYVLDSGGLFCTEDGEVLELFGPGRDAGRRKITGLDPDHLIAVPGRAAGHRIVQRQGLDILSAVIETSSAFLAGQVEDDGRFIYGWHPCFDRQINAYNGLRHASTTYAMIEAWEVTQCEVLWAAIERSLAWLRREAIRTIVLPDGTEAAFLVDVGNEIKLGANAVAILAFTQHATVTGCTDHLLLLEKLALGVQHMQRGQDGSFIHVLNYPDLTVKETFRTIYYEGEAAFGLMRLYSLTGDERWLKTVEKAFDHFIAKEHWRHNDHWLSYCVNELTRYRPEERYFRFGIENVRGHLDFVLNRITTFPTLLELMMASEAMLARIETIPDKRHLLSEINLTKFYRALHYRARYLLNGYFWPELAMFFANPAKITGSFFIRHHAFRVRIDDVEHYLSGFIAYRKYLLAREASPDRHDEVVAPDEGAQHWTAKAVERATGGQWHSPPAPDWSASGLCIFTPTLREGDIVAVRLAEGEKGVPAGHLDRLRHKPAAIVASDPTKVAVDGVPVLVVDHAGKAILALGEYARSRMTGKLIGITGSAGKTTAVAMLSHALASFGPVGQTRHNANLPHGIAWNLASIPWDTPNTVLELAIGRMAQNAKLTQPDIAIFTNILPAHLEYHRDLATIADRKSAIFQGMAPGSIVILNREMAEWSRVQVAARSCGLTVINYGKSQDCDVQLCHYDPEARRVMARFGGRDLCYSVGAAGEHMALNSLTVLAAVSALGHDLEPVIARLGDFAPVAGRGEELELTLGGLHLTVVDEAYNANPGSMDAALALLGEKKSAGRRIAVLGEMLELGEGAADYHTRLAPLIEHHDVDLVYATGDLYDGFWDEVPEGRRGSRPDSLDALKQALCNELRDGDVLLVKGSHSTGMHKVVDWLKDGASISDPHVSIGVP